MLSSMTLAGLVYVSLRGKTLLILVLGRVRSFFQKAERLSLRAHGAESTNTGTMTSLMAYAIDDPVYIELGKPMKML